MYNVLFPGVELSPQRYLGVINVGSCYAQIMFSRSVYEIVLILVEVPLFHFNRAEVAWIAQTPMLHSSISTILSMLHCVQNRLDFLENKIHKDLGSAPPMMGIQSKRNGMRCFPWMVVSLGQEKLCGLVGCTPVLSLWWDIAVPD